MFENHVVKFVEVAFEGVALQNFRLGPLYLIIEFLVEPFTWLKALLYRCQLNIQCVCNSFLFVVNLIQSLH